MNQCATLAVFIYIFIIVAVMNQCVATLADRLTTGACFHQRPVERVQRTRSVAVCDNDDLPNRSGYQRPVGIIVSVLACCLPACNVPFTTRS